jgi:hypothetical protein
MILWYFRHLSRLSHLRKSAAKTEFIAIALGDESTVLAAASTTVPVVTYHMPYGFTLTNVKVGLTAAGTGAALATFDVHEAGSNRTIYKGYSRR